MRQIVLRAHHMLILSFLLTGAGHARANLIQNGGFESPVLAPGQDMEYSGGSTAISGWTVVGDNVLLIQTPYSELGAPYYDGMVQFNAQSSLNSLDLTGGGDTDSPTDGIQQTVTTTPGDTYLLSFYVGRAQSNNGDSRYQNPATADLSINGGPRVSFTNSDLPPSGYVDWKQFTTSFLATGSTTTITFPNGTPVGTNFAGLDNVVLVDTTSVPEPTSLILIGVDVGGVTGYTWRQQKGKRKPQGERNGRK
jgi:hypothetical protein